MLLLSIDTSGKRGSIALAQCTPPDACEILETVPLAGGTFSAQLVPQIAALLNNHGFTKHDLGAFAAVSGPGSFTGLRVGLAAIKALAETLGKPIAAVSLLEAIAASSNASGNIIAALDAGRNEVYAAEYSHGVLSGPGERLLTWKEFSEFAQARHVFTPDKTIFDQAIAAGVTANQIDYPRSEVIAQLAWKKIQAGQTISPEDLDANYIRRSDAEIFSAPR